MLVLVADTLYYRHVARAIYSVLYKTISDTKQWAMYGRQYETCEYLVEKGADPEYR
jgi:hypothetical protein